VIIARATSFDMMTHKIKAGQRKMMKG